jgi:septal ring factor EnvC (AmiA/AmiB activator)
MFVLFSALLISAFVPPAQAKQPDPQTALEKTADEFQDYKKKSQDLQEKEREILGAMYKLNRRQRRLAQQKAQQLQKREGLEADIMHLEKNISEVSEQIKQLKKKLIVRVRNLHRVNTPTIFQSIFGAQDITEMDRNARILYKISKSDVDQLRTFRGLKNLLDQQQVNLEGKLAEFEKTQKDLEKQENAIKQTYLAQTTLLRRLDTQDKVIIDKLKKIKKRAGILTKNDAGEMETLFEAGLYEKRGTLELPVNGVVTQKFGLMPLLQDKIRVYNKGWFISTAPSREVTSVYKGRVIYSGIMDDYNRVLIVDHGDHFYSVYANLQNPSVGVGDEVDTQQSLGRVTQSRLFGNGLYFEIRHFSQSEDPAEWFKDKGINLSSKEHI